MAWLNVTPLIHGWHRLDKGATERKKKLIPAGTSTTLELSSVCTSYQRTVSACSTRHYLETQDNYDEVSSSLSSICAR